MFASDFPVIFTRNNEKLKKKKVKVLIRYFVQRNNKKTLRFLVISLQEFNASIVVNHFQWMNILYSYIRKPVSLQQDLTQVTSTSAANVHIIQNILPI